MWQATRSEGLLGDEDKIDMIFHCDMAEGNKCKVGLYMKRQARARGGGDGRSVKGSRVLLEYCSTACEQSWVLYLAAQMYHKLEHLRLQGT